MSKETTASSPKSESPVRTTVERVNGVVPGVVHLALDVADRGQSTALSLLNDGRTELVSLIAGSIDLAEKATAAWFRLMRRASTRIDEASSETLASVERLATTTVKSARETTRAATDLATTALGGVTGASN